MCKKGNFFVCKIKFWFLKIINSDANGNDDDDYYCICYNSLLKKTKKNSHFARILIRILLIIEILKFVNDKSNVPKASESLLKISPGSYQYHLNNSFRTRVPHTKRTPFFPWHSQESNAKQSTQTDKKKKPKNHCLSKKS